MCFMEVDRTSHARRSKVVTEPPVLLWGEETCPCQGSGLLPTDFVLPLHAWVEQLTCLSHLLCP